MATGVLLHRWPDHRQRQTRSSGKRKRVDYLLFEHLDVPFLFSSNGDGFVFHDRTGTNDNVEETLSLDDFPPPE